MIKTLRESKAKLSELVEQASRGQEVLITVRGKVKARLSSVKSVQQENRGAAWAEELQALHKAWCRQSRKSVNSQAVLDSVRGDRF